MRGETDLGSPPSGHRAHTYTHTPFFPRPGITWTSRPLFPGFPFGHPEPQVPATGSPGWRGFENHRPKTDHTYKSSLFPVLLRVLRTHDTPHTYVLSLKRLPRTDRTLLCLRLFEFPFPISWCNITPYSASEFPGFTLLRFTDKLRIR